MKKNQFIKKAIDENIANKEEILYNILNNSCYENVHNKKSIKHKRIAFRMAASLAAILMVVIVFDNLPLSNFTRLHKNKKMVQQNSVSIQQEKNMFTLVAYAAENPTTSNSNVPAIKMETKTVLKPNAKIKMPGGKIKSDGSFYGESFEFIGDNIESITLTSVTGTLNYFNVKLLKEMEAKGELNICQIPFSKLKIDQIDCSFETLKETFYRMWSSGELDEYKNKYFQGKNINLDDYSIGYHGSGKDPKKYFFQIANKQNGYPPYNQSGNTMVLNTANSDNLNISWNPTKACDMLYNHSQVNFKDLPGDTITVIVKFKDGQNIKQSINLSFDEEGNVVGEVKELN